MLLFSDTDSILLPKASDWLIGLVEELRTLNLMWLLDEEIICSDCVSNVHLIVIGVSLRERTLSLFMLRLISHLLQIPAFCPSNLILTLINRILCNNIVPSVHRVFHLLAF